MILCVLLGQHVLLVLLVGLPIESLLHVISTTKVKSIGKL